VARGGAKSRLLEGMTLSNRDFCTRPARSDNRAVSALGRAVDSHTQFTEAMNRKVATLDCATRASRADRLSSDNSRRPERSSPSSRRRWPTRCWSRATQDRVRRPPVSKPRLLREHAQAGGQGNVQCWVQDRYNDTARYCLVLAARIGERNYAWPCSDEGDRTRFGTSRASPTGS